MLVGTGVLMVKVQPPAMLPWSPGPWSWTNNDHVPLGLVPLKLASGAVYGPAGAGDAKLGEPKAEGLNVPETIWLLSGSVLAAASSNVSVTPLTPLAPPAEAMT